MNVTKNRKNYRKYIITSSKCANCQFASCKELMFMLGFLSDYLLTYNIKLQNVRPDNPDSKIIWNTLSPAIIILCNS